VATHPLLGELILCCEGEVPLLFTENETNHERLFPGQKNESLYVKDGINNCVVQGNQAAVNPDKHGTKLAAHHRVKIDAGQAKVIRLRLSKNSPDRKRESLGKQFDEVFANRLREADEFYKSVTPPSVSEDAAKVMRQALAGMLWSKQFFFFDGDNWNEVRHRKKLENKGLRHTWRNQRVAGSSPARFTKFFNKAKVISIYREMGVSRSCFRFTSGLLLGLAGQ
jgi:hypothetical protein